MKSFSSRSTALVGLLTATLSLTGCAALTTEGDQATSESRQIATAFYPLQFVAESVAGDRFTVTNLTNPGQEPHDLELSLRQTARLEEARLVVYESGMQPAVEEAVAQRSGSSLDAAEVVDLVPFEDHADQAEAAEESHDHEHGDDHDHDHGDSDGDEAGGNESNEAHGSHEGHDHGDEDPHFWLDPIRMGRLATALAERLGELDPDHADTYDERAEALVGRLKTLDREYRTGLRSCTRDTVVVSHDAFGYLSRYGLEIRSITGLSPDAEATPAQLAALEKLIADEQITTVFGETLKSTKMSESLARDAGVKTAVLDPLEGLSDETSDQDYFSIMRSNLTALRKANGC